MELGEASPYEQLGGKEAVERLVHRFYDEMDALEEAQEIRAMHARSLKASREKLILFLTGWLGGPPLYVEKYGHPRLRARHLPFAIGERARQQWMLCMDRALEAEVEEEALRSFVRQALDRVAAHMRNRVDKE